MKKTDDNNAGYEFAAMLLSLMPSFLLLLIFAVLYRLDVIKEIPLSTVLFFTSAFVASITHGIMGLEVNRKVKRIDLLKGGTGLEIIKTYYSEIGKSKKIPFTLILFILSTVLAAGIIVYSYIEDGGWIAGILILVIILLLFFLRYMSKKHNLQNIGK